MAKKLTKKEKEEREKLIKILCERIATLHTLLLDFEYYDSSDPNGKFFAGMHVRTREFTPEVFFKELTDGLYGDNSILFFLEEIKKYYKIDIVKNEIIVETLFTLSNDLFSLPKAHSLQAMKIVILDFKRVFENLHVRYSTSKDSDSENKMKFLNDLNIRANVFSLRKILADISLFLSHMVSEPKKIYPIISRKKITANESFDLISFCFGNFNKYFLANEVSAAIMGIFFIRQSIELKIFEIFNITNILNSKNETMRISGDKILEFLNDFDENVVLPHGINRNVLLNINKWCNRFVHYGAANHFWLIHFAYLNLIDFIPYRIFMKESYYKNLKNALTNKPIHIENIIQSNSKDNNILLDDLSFEKLNKIISKYGYKNYKDYMMYYNEEKMQSDYKSRLKIANQEHKIRELEEFFNDIDKIFSK